MQKFIKTHLEEVTGGKKFTWKQKLSKMQDFFSLME